MSIRENICRYLIGIIYILKLYICVMNYMYIHVYTSVVYHYSVKVRYGKVR